jgi:hypothetical protein
MLSFLKTVCLAALVTLMTTNGLFAQPNPDQPPSERQPPREGQPRQGGFQRPPFPLMDALDANRDGEISAEELKNAAAALRSIDKNKDGQLTENEFGMQFPPGFQPQGFGGGGPGSGRGGPPRDQKILKDFDEDGNGRLNSKERAAALATLKSQGSNRPRRGPRGPQPSGPAAKGISIAPADVESFPKATLYDKSVLRTVFIDFDFETWQEDMAALKHTDIDVPATMIVDGQTYPNVGVHFRGMSSFSHIPATYKRSLNVSLDFVDSKQQLYGYKTLNLLNSNGDAAMMSSVLYSHLAQEHLPVPKANLVKVVINGEYWGVFANVQQFNKQFLDEHFGSSKGARWKVSGNPNADGGLRFLGDNIDDYRQRFEIKSKDTEAPWRALIELCRVLEETPTNKLQAALEPLLDVDGLLWFLALDVALVNSDGYWTRASDYNIFLDKSGKFHILPHDMNEAFKDGRGGGPGRPPGGGGPGGGRPGFEGPEGRPGAPPAGDNRGQRDPRGGGQPGFGGRNQGPGGGRPGHGDTTLEPLIGIDNPRMPLRSKILVIPELKERYLQYVKVIANDLEWKKVAPLVAETRRLISNDVKLDSKKLTTFDAFMIATNDKPEPQAPSLRNFFDKRRAFLLKHEAIASLPKLEEPEPQELRTLANSPVIINEVMAANQTVIKDSQGKFGDWIELHNRSKKTVDLSGLFLSDDEEQLRKWSFPAGTKIKPGQFLVVWAGGAKTANELRTNFKLSKSGEFLCLSAVEDGQSVVWESLEFPAQEVDVSLGRTTGGDFTALAKPTPGVAN